MPNTKSAGRRMRNSARKQLQNHSVKTRLHHLELTFAGLQTAGKKDEVAVALRQLSSAFDKAVKTGVINRPMANRKKSRLTLRLNKTKPATPQP
jgi:small subunit ribosomal protein S20